MRSLMESGYFVYQIFTTPQGLIGYLALGLLWGNWRQNHFRKYRFDSRSRFNIGMVFNFPYYMLFGDGDDGDDPILVTNVWGPAYWIIFAAIWPIALLWGLLVPAFAGALSIFYYVGVATWKFWDAAVQLPRSLWLLMQPIFQPDRWRM